MGKRKRSPEQTSEEVSTEVSKHERMQNGGGFCVEQEETALEERLEQTILNILHKRAASSTICPSEAARAVSPTNWRPLMDKTREVARRMAMRGDIHITQSGLVCNPLAEIKGPIRLKIAAK